MITFPYLVDAPEDGEVEQNAWLPVDAATSPEAAVEEFLRRYADTGCEPWWIDDGHVLTCTGRAFYRGMLEISVGLPTGACECGHRSIIHASQSGCTARDGDRRCGCGGYRAAVVVKQETVVATDEHHADGAIADEIRFEKCEPDDDGAEEYWCLELVEP